MLIKYVLIFKKNFKPDIDLVQVKSRNLRKRIRFCFSVEPYQTGEGIGVAQTMTWKPMRPAPKSCPMSASSSAFTTRPGPPCSDRVSPNDKWRHFAAQPWTYSNTLWILKVRRHLKPKNFSNLKQSYFVSLLVWPCVVWEKMGSLDKMHILVFPHGK